MSSSPQIPGFELIDIIGRGGMAVVWRARQVSLDRIVAVKILHPGAGRQPDDRERLMAEAHAAALLNHPGIVQVHDAGAVDDISYFVMEYVAGYSVGAWLRRSKRLSVEDALAVAEYVCQALHYAWHTGGVIHCDIKPDNIMVDRDGTIKVADLGLARNIGQVACAAEDEAEIMGTPSYMSPEQSSGLPDLDCRADIYSLGATLYHMVTGKRLFEEQDDSRIMESQIYEQDEDPFSLDQGIPLELCWLIEKMLVKDRVYRYSSWDAVLADIERVKTGELPQGPFPAEGASTVKQGKPRLLKTHEREASSKLARRRRKLGLRLGLVAGAAAMTALAWLLLMAASREARHDPGADPRDSSQEEPSLADPGGQAGQLYQFVVNWIEQNPQNHDDAIRRLEMVAENHPGTRYALKAEDRLREVRDDRSLAIERTYREVRSDIEAVASAGRLREAAGMASGYDGPWAEEITSRLSDLSATLAQQADDLEQADARAREEEERRFRKMLEELVSTLVGGSVGDAARYLAGWRSETETTWLDSELEMLSGLFKSVRKLDREVLRSFAAQVGDKISIDFVRGSRDFKILGVEDDQLRVGMTLDSGAQVEFEFTTADLSPREYIGRVGQRTGHHVALALGLIDYQAGSFAAASNHFALTHPLLAGLLVEKCSEKQRLHLEERAEEEFSRMVGVLPLRTRPDDHRALLQELRQVALAADAPGLPARVADFRETYKETRFLVRVAPLLDQLEEAARRAGEARPEVTAEEAAFEMRDFDAVRHMLCRRNPGLTEDDVTILFAPGNVPRGIEIDSRHLSDIRPLANLRNLKTAVCRGENISDLFSLSNLHQLSELTIEGCTADDFQPLLRLPLEKLELPGANIHDLNLLRAAPLRELNLDRTSIRDLRPLRGKPIRSLTIENTRVASIQALHGMPLERLNLAGTSIRDISPLRDLPLRELNLARTSIPDMSAIAGMPLQALDLSRTEFSDLRVLGDLPLRSLNLSSTPVRDLSPLRGMGTLQTVRLEHTRVSDIRALSGLPIRHLGLRGTRIHDYSPLRDMPLETLTVSRPDSPRVASVLARIPTLRRVNGIPVNR